MQLACLFLIDALIAFRSDLTFFMATPDALPKQWRKAVAAAQSETDLARIVCDYISGMTDRFALQEWKRLRKSMLRASAGKPR